MSLRSFDPAPEPAHAEVVGRHVQLGKAPAKKDKRNLKLAKYAPRAAQLPPLPQRVRRSQLVAGGFGMYLNDGLPDCTIATAANIERLVSVVGGQPDIPTDAEVLEMFDATGPRDEGRYELDVLNYWRGTGMGVERERIHAFVQIDPKNDKLMRYAIFLFGAVYAGVALPRSAQTQKVWKVGRGADGRPGSWGGHAVPLVNYDRYGYDCVTWGEVVRMTAGFWHAYGDEAYAVVHPDWISKLSGKSPLGFDLAKLDEDLQAIGA